MGDLISRKALIRKLFYAENGSKYPTRDCDNFHITISLEALRKVIRDIPTAYDVDGVVEQLAKRFDYCHEMAEKNDKAKLEKMAFSWRQVANGVMDAIEIVKGAVKDE